MYRLLRALLFLLPAETAHHFAFALLRLGMRLPLLGTWVRHCLRPRNDSLVVDALGLKFPSPVGLAAGFDKDARGYNELSDLGFGFIEVGTVTAEAQPGNPKPRLFRLKQDRALINRMGFNNAGAEAVRARLQSPRRTIIGVNIGKTKVVSEEDAIADYTKSARLLGPLCDYLVVNVSSPNTPGLRALQAVDKLRPLLFAVQQTLLEHCPTPPPLLVKVAPDLNDEEIDAVAALCLDLKLNGIIATNTTLARSGLSTPSTTVDAIGAGGLSGAPLKSRAIQVLRRLAEKVGGKLTIVSAGGIEGAEDVRERLAAGATLVQVYTGFIYEGPLLPSRINRTLVEASEPAR